MPVLHAARRFRRGAASELLARRAGGEIAFRRIAVETSGLADPGPILYALFADARLAAETRLVQVTTVVDAGAGLATLERHGEARRQVALADRLVVSKGAADAPLRAALARLAPTAAISAAADFDAAAFLDAFPRSAAKKPEARERRMATQARVFRSARPIEPARFARFQQACSAKVSGAAAVAGQGPGGDGGRARAAVAGARRAACAGKPPLRLAEWPPGPQETALTAIGEDVEAAERLWAALTGALAARTRAGLVGADGETRSRRRRGAGCAFG